MRKRMFQSLKRTFMQVSGLPPTYFDVKTHLKSNWFFYRNLVGEDLSDA